MNAYRFFDKVLSELEELQDTLNKLRTLIKKRVQELQRT